MNEIEIDEKNGIAIVEPYVIHAQLHAEAIKRGWSCNIIGAGSSCSVVAAACAYSGIGAGTMWMGGNAENVLGMEWVTLSGEIVRNGSLGSGDGWFCGEGPGPSVRGIMRGTLGSRGGMGVYTKCAVRSGPLARFHRLAGLRAPCPPTGCLWTRPSAPTPWPSPPGTRGPTSTTGSTTTRSATPCTGSTTWPAPTWLPRSGSCTTTPPSSSATFPT